MVKTLVAIPAYNEDTTIGDIVLRAREHVDEVLVIDDGSVDATRRVARLAEATVLSHPTNLGKGSAIRTAFDYAWRNGHQAVVLLDGDGQHDCDEIPLLLKPILEGEAELVLGKRRGGQDGMPLYRRAGNRILDYMTATLTGVITDSQCGFRAFSRTAIDLLDLSTDGFGIESEMLIRATEAGLRMAEVPIKSRYDVDGSTLTPVEHGFRVANSILRIGAERYPVIRRLLRRRR